MRHTSHQSHAPCCRLASKPLANTSMLFLVHLCLHVHQQAMPEPTQGLQWFPKFPPGPWALIGLPTCMKRGVCRLLVPLSTTCGSLVEFCMVIPRVRPTQKRLREPMPFLNTWLTTWFFMPPGPGSFVEIGILKDTNCHLLIACQLADGKRFNTSSSCGTV